MFIYNVTFNLEESIQEKWLTWMYNDFFKEATVFKNFTSATIHQVLIEEELGGITFAVHFNTPTTTQLVQFQLQDLTLLEAKNGAII